MLAPILALSLIVTTPLAVYGASTWPNERKAMNAPSEERERFLDDLSGHQSFRRERDRSEFDGEERPRALQNW